MVVEQGKPMLASDILNLTFFPIGTILQFSGGEYTRLTSARTEDDEVIWTLCNGTDVNGITVPNLVDKFLRGAASSGTAAGADSQSVTLTADNLPSHNHGVGSLAMSALSATELPVSGLSASGFSVSGQTISGLTIDNAGAHTHTVSGDAVEAGSHDHTFSNGSAASAGGHTHTVTAHDSNHSATPQYTDYSVSEYGEYHSATYTTSSGGAHTHTVSGTIANGGAHTHTISGSAVEGGSHSHTVNSSNATISGGSITGNITGGTVSGSIAASAITGSTGSVGSSAALTIDTLPSYYTVVYIMKVA
ncbi:phage tail fiber protein [Candidatus Termititenax aidoneus]|uniref:Phage tail fiber protein n=1 Tax=Termititenax aidoneus TaxID=2218524 RepID=A0A388TCL5_TERA1|nr:phage tail fiber protein [Candidatus Termititenax aidoneus]